MDWTRILKAGGVEEPPGREEVMASFVERPYKAIVRKKGKKKGSTRQCLRFLVSGYSSVRPRKAVLNGMRTTKGLEFTLSPQGLS